jgi:hypothetical protein
MPRRFHDRFGTAGVIVAVIALVAALGGTALAASGALSGKQKKEVEKIAKKFAGKPGAVGPAGPAGSAGGKGDTGAAGANGKDGTNGTNGSNGAPGKNVALTAITTAGLEGNCVGVGGTKVEVEGNAASKKFVCNGSPWTAGGTLPPGETETGVWGGAFAPLAQAGALEMQIPISFPIPLPGSGSAFIFTLEQMENEEFGKTGGLENEGCVVGTEGCVDTGCEGTVEHPTAPAGVLCVYTAHEENEKLASPFFAFNFESGGFLPTGTLIHFFIQGEPARFDMNGSWAVTAPTS